MLSLNYENHNDSNTMILILKCLFFLLLILVVGSEVSCTGNKDLHTQATNNSEQKQFVCSMHPQVVQDKAGDCPICGMFLIEIIIDKNPADSLLTEVVRPVNESVLSTIATVTPYYEEIPLIIEGSGKINFDNRKTQMVSARFGGLIEKSYVKFQFQRITKGQKIYEIYCPNIYTERWNYIKLIQMYPDQDNLTIEAREWLNLLGLTAEQVESLKRSVKPDYHLAVYSPAEGYAINADFDAEKYSDYGEGQSISPSGNNGIGLNDGVTIVTGTPLFKVVDANWFRADIQVKTEEVGHLRKGQKVIFTVDASSEKKYEATIHQIEPLNGGVFQLIKVYFRNNDGALLAGRQIHAHILTHKRNSIWVPETAVVHMGSRQSVFVKCNNKFLATLIKTGMHTGNKIEVLSGITQGSQVALNASLLIDSDGLIK